MVAAPAPPAAVVAAAVVAAAVAPQAAGTGTKVGVAVVAVVWRVTVSRAALPMLAANAR